MYNNFELIIRRHNALQFTMYSDFFRLLRTDGIEAATSTAARAGFSSVETLEIGAPSLIPDEERARHARAILDAHGLSLACYSIVLDLLPLSPTDFHEQEVLSVAEAAARIAHILGAPYVHHTLIPNLDPVKHGVRPPFEAIFEELIERAARVAEICNRLGITVLYEPQGFFVNGVRNFGLFYREMQRRGYDVGVCGDIGNVLFIDDSPVEFYRAFAAEFRHVHLKDYRTLTPDEAPPRGSLASLGGTVYAPVPIGQGVIDYETCAQLLQTAGYRAAFALEDSHASVDAMRAEMQHVQEYFQSTIQRRSNI